MKLKVTSCKVINNKISLIKKVYLTHFAAVKYVSLCNKFLIGKVLNSRLTSTNMNKITRCVK